MQANEAEDARVQERISACGWRCLAADLKGMHACYRLVCGDGHEWESTGSEILRGRGGCRRCATNANQQTRRAKEADRLAGRAFRRLRAVARSKGGECLSTVYLTGFDHYLFRCKQGHEWSAIASDVFRSSWCGTCAKDAGHRPVMPLRLCGVDDPDDEALE